jgi:hypothetical protein
MHRRLVFISIKQSERLVDDGEQVLFHCICRPYVNPCEMLGHSAASTLTMYAVLQADIVAAASRHDINTLGVAYQNLNSLRTSARDQCIRDIDKADVDKDGNRIDHITGLPPELLYLIFRNLKELDNVARTCRAFAKVTRWAGLASVRAERPKAFPSYIESNVQTVTIHNRLAWPPSEFHGRATIINTPGLDWTGQKPIPRAADISVPKVCGTCGLPATQRCTGCWRIRFCNVKCMRRSWRFHKEYCAYIRRIVPDGQCKELTHF